MSEMIGSDLRFKVPLSWEGPVRISETWRGSGELYVRRSVRLPDFEWFEEGFDVDQPLGWEALEASWSGELNYGWYDSDGEALLEWLRRHRVPYAASSDAKYEFDGTLSFYDGNADGVVVDRSAANAGIVLAFADWHSMLLDAGATASGVDVNRWLVESVHRWFNIGNLDACDISHLPECPPQDEEE